MGQDYETLKIYGALGSHSRSEVVRATFREDGVLAQALTPWIPWRVSLCASVFSSAKLTNTAFTGFQWTLRSNAYESMG